MKIKNGFLLRKVGEQNIVVAIGDESRNFNGIIRLNDTGSFLWEKLQQDISESGLVLEMLREYEIDEATAEVDVHEFIDTLREAGLLE
ncbi:MAG: PqqD family protein [Ruminiclostridium sp.]|nr:PqqD family protein [Ruminiclostridium sp.]MBQ8410865.1 PqqD family protein [Ruminiclostridium sp.]MBQ8841383.1 PqqD family protein [Ruminiclostridium sp.]